LNPPGESLSEAGRLFVVATPIGNLGDITLRALEVLRAVPLIAAEDTRVTRRLLARYEIPARTVSYHARNARARTPELLTHLRSGRDLALVTDAGTPGISDPGSELVRAWLDEGGRVVPLPGPSSVLAAVVASGIAGPRWSFEGFLPRAGRERRDRLARIAGDDRAAVLFEAPGRVRATIADLAEACGNERRAAICRELTKLHEQVRRGSLGELADGLSSGEIPERGEFVIVVDGVAGGARAPAATDTGRVDAARAEVARLRADGLGHAAAVRRVAAATGLPRRQLYEGPEPG
jgi:16S rRNA (cytidine1402-2'-O)-methyltransferase